MDINETRLTNGRLAIEKIGGVTKAAKLLGLKNASYLSQMFGPNPSRMPGEKFIRRMEEAFNLPRGDLDGQPTGVVPAKTQTAIDPKLLASVMQTVNRVMSEEHVQMSDDRFATLVALTYDDPQGESRLRQIVQLFK